MATEEYVREYGVDVDSPAGAGPLGPRRCPGCAGSDIRRKFGHSDKPILYCLDCLMGTGEHNNMIIDMMLFPSCIRMRDAKRAALAAAAS